MTLSQHDERSTCALGTNHGQYWQLPRVSGMLISATQQLIGTHLINSTWKLCVMTRCWGILLFFKRIAWQCHVYLRRPR